MVERTSDGRIRTTEWEDIQYKHGNRVGLYRDREIDIVAQKLADQRPDAQLEAYDPNAEHVRSKMERGGYDEPINGVEGASAVDDDDEALAQYRQKRVAQLQAAKVSKRGRVVRISGAQYVEEITQSSHESFVVALMVQDGHEGCDNLLRVMTDVSAKHTDVKFVALPATEAIAQFPAKHLPCVLVYRDGGLVRQLTGLDVWGGKRLSRESCERALAATGAIPRPDDDGSDEERGAAKPSKYYSTGL